MRNCNIEEGVIISGTALDGDGKSANSISPSSRIAPMYAAWPPRNRRRRVMSRFDSRCRVSVQEMSNRAGESYLPLHPIAVIAISLWGCKVGTECENIGRRWL